MQKTKGRFRGCRVAQTVEKTLLSAEEALRAPETHFGPRLLVFQVYPGFPDCDAAPQIFVVWIFLIACIFIMQKLYLGFRGFWNLKVVQNSMASAMALLRRSEAIVCFL